MRLRMLARRGPFFIYLGAGFLTAAGIWYYLTSNVSSTTIQHHQYQVPHLVSGLQQPLQLNNSTYDTPSNNLLHVQYQVPPPLTHLFSSSAILTKYSPRR